MTVPPDFLYWYRARCLRVVDGHTVDVVTDLGFRIGWEQRVRLYGLDTFELNDPDAAKRALAVKGKEFVAARIEGRVVILNTFKDRGDNTAAGWPSWTTLRRMELGTSSMAS